MNSEPHGFPSGVAKTRIPTAKNASLSKTKIATTAEDEGTNYLTTELSRSKYAMYNFLNRATGFFGQETEDFTAESSNIGERSMTFECHVKAICHIILELVKNRQTHVPPPPQPMTTSTTLHPNRVPTVTRKMQFSPFNEHNLFNSCSCPEHFKITFDAKDITGYLFLHSTRRTGPHYWPPSPKHHH